MIVCAKYVHYVLFNRLERLNLPRNSVVMLTDRRTVATA